MSAGRVWTYTHSDSITRHKGAAMIKVLCQTDFAANTKDFETFAADMAKLAYASQADTWTGIVEMFPDAEDRRAALCNALREQVHVTEIAIFKL